MCKVSVPVNCCDPGDVLAEDVNNNKGVTLVAKNTVVNSYIKSKLLEMGIPNVWLYQPEELLDHQEKGIRHKEVEKNYRNNVLSVKKFLNDLSSGGIVDYKKVEEISKLVFDGINEGSHIIKYIAKIKSADDYTYTHCVNVAFYSMLIAKWLGFDEYNIREVIQAGLLHDVGKINVPNEILNKNGKLTPEEFEVMKKHSTYGFKMIRDIPDIGENIKKAVLQHHEKIDGSGYPDKLYGDDLELYAKIIAIADVYDAMTQNRVYKKKVSPFETFEMFLTTGIGIYDTIVLKTFLKHLAAFYVGTKVLLSNGNTGEIVYIPPHDIISPVVNVGSSYIDLSRKKDLKILAIL